MSLRDAITAEDWPGALGLAIEAWRASRSPGHADLVDRIGARIPGETVPAQRAQRWWLQRARTYEPVAAGGLLANAAELAGRAGVEAKLFARLEHLATWPDDPRTATVLARWFADANIGWMYAHDAKAMTTFYERIAAILVRLRDPRVIPRLARVRAEPRAKTVVLRELLHRLAQSVIDALGSHEPSPVADEVARWAPVSAAPAPTRDEHALWLAAADSEAARLVLADALLERGDRRGEVITLAAAGERDRGLALLHAHWERWMGELALVLDRGFCTFTGGVLEIAVAGMRGTPEWAYPKVAGHRELVTIQTVRPGWRASPKGYVAFLDALPRLPRRVRLHATMLEPLALARRHWPVRVLELVTNVDELRTPLTESIAVAASVLPEVEEIELPLPGEIDHRVIASARELPRLFPRLAGIRIDAAQPLPRDIRDALLALAAAVPMVTIEHGTYQP